MLLGTLLIGGGTLAAQNSAPAGYTGHPLVGSWLLDTDGDPETLPSLAYYSADGGYIKVDPDGQRHVTQDRSDATLRTTKLDISQERRSVSVPVGLGTD
jgi:hypothetical protein